MERVLPMSSQRFEVSVAANGRMVLPAAVRSALGITGESKVTLVLSEGEAAIQPMSAHLRRARALYRAHAVEARTVDDFLRDRARED